MCWQVVALINECCSCLKYTSFILICQYFFWPDPEYKDEDVIYEVTRSDIKILKQIHSLGDEQYKRLMAYMKALQKLEQMENMVEE